MIEHDVTNEGHRDRCAECTEVWADLERISAEARALPTLTPSRDLWAGIEERLVDRDGAATMRRRPRWFQHPAVRLATAASLLVAATATVTWRMATRPSTADLPVALASGGGESPVGASTDDLAARRDRQVSFEREFGPIDREISTLESLLAAQREQLDPATVAVVERNLAVIDRAIAESRAALLKDPASRFLATQLARSYSSKLNMLRDLATLPAGT
jgi:hypothetical protein